MSNPIKTPFQFLSATIALAGIVSILYAQTKKAKSSEESVKNERIGKTGFGLLLIGGVMFIIAKR